MLKEILGFYSVIFFKVCNGVFGEDVEWLDKGWKK